MCMRDCITHTQTEVVKRKWKRKRTSCAAQALSVISSFIILNSKYKRRLRFLHNRDKVLADNRHIIIKQQWKQSRKEERMSLCKSTLAQGYQWHSFRFNISPSILTHRNCQWEKCNWQRMMTMTDQTQYIRCLCPDKSIIACHFICNYSSKIDWSILLHQVC